MATPEELMGLGGSVPGSMPDVQSVGLYPELEVPDEPEIRGSVQDWAGGKPINLKKKLKNGKILRDELSTHLTETLSQELKNQEKLIERLKRWHKLYKAEKKGARPKPWMADVSIPVARKISDSIFVRIHDMVWNKMRVFLFRPRGIGTPESNEKMQIWEKAFNNYVKNDLGLKDKMRFPTRQAVNSGTGVVKISYEVKNKTITDFATEDEKIDPSVKKYKSTEGNLLVKRPNIVFRGPNVYPVDRARFIISSDALTIDDAYLVGFSFDRRKKYLETLAKRKIYDEDAVKRISATKPEDIVDTRANSEGKALDKTTYTEPYTLHELWLKYDVDGDGEEDDIVVTFHKESGQILKAIYNPIFYGYRPFVDMKGASQVEYTYDGEGICEIVEVMSEELDTLHNLMLDRMKLINLPIIFAQAGIGLDDYDLEPGKIKTIDGNPKEQVEIVKQPDVTFSLVNEINWLIGQMDLVCGITPGALGVSTAERPVAKETMMMAEEYNKKFKSWTDNARGAYREIGFRLLEAFAQYQPTYVYTDEMGQEQEVEMPTGNIRDYLDLDLSVSSEEWNMTARREVELMKWQLLREHLTGNVGLAQMLCNPQVPSEFKKYLVQVNAVGSRALTKVLENFEDTEPDSTNVDLSMSMDLEKCIMQSIDLMPQQPMGPPGQPGQPPVGEAPQPSGQPGVM